MPADFKPPDSPQPASSISYFPYFESTYLAVAASLNGGNVLASFVEMLTSWMRELGLYSSSIFYTLIHRHPSQENQTVQADLQMDTDTDATH